MLIFLSRGFDCAKSDRGYWDVNADVYFRNVAQSFVMKGFLANVE